MSPRAACRLERLGFSAVYDYVAGKADWLAAGLATERNTPARRVLDAADLEPLTCAVDERADVAVDRMRSAGQNSCVVLDPSGVVLGRLRLERLREGELGLVDDVMEPG